MSIHSALLAASDPYIPSVSIPSLQQYDNYQTHDLYCEDIIYQDLIIADDVIAAPRSIKFRSFLAVEKISSHGSIPFDFNSIAIMYP
jgi:hypothetical protein